ncbi:radical SAM family heme chaperone HemW [Rickettsia endosymbiont of Oedothorax gibbosus]|uniref:radical SAM family heme chaperone HemW n=1 Tax=Rickettsia endosymbiont of Oedothorax gibbosus TaxID=931099 RepID=UPI00202510B3|nr:radical SAM family heme chaperone HemW [Rickettsia endosymbiont of Oedothorax gibbosus]
MKEPLSIYIHWPFCLSKCPYCDFNSHVSDKVDHNDWLKCYELELNHFKDTIGHKYIKSIFFGGGTPSLMKPFVVEGIISKIANLAIIDEYTEITLETNPTSFETEKFKDFRLAGINRVSIGVQSLVETDLKSLGRQHDVGQAIKTIEIARRIFPRISFDLIYARSNQTLKSWQDELTNAMQLASGHISLYQLFIEKGTLFYKLFNDGNLTIPSSDQAADQYEWTNLYLKSQGYFRYEISNYAMLGHECKHNLTYWQYNNYLGIGPGAHSRVNMYDSDFTSNLYSIMMWHKPEKWLQTVKSLGCGIQHINKLSMQEITEEMLMMGLRLENGLNIDLIQKRTGKQLFDILDIQKAIYYKKLDLLQWNEGSGDKGHINLTDKGLMLHSYIVPRLFSQ